MSDRARLNFIVNEKHRLITIRPIGVLSQRDLLDQLFESYTSVIAPWTYHRVRDFRRWSCTLDPAMLHEFKVRWSKLTCHVTYNGFIAFIPAEASDRVRCAAPSPDFPHETICEFSDYHEAVGWLLAEDRAAYLAGLACVPVRRNDAHAIRID